MEEKIFKHPMSDSEIREISSSPNLTIDQINDFSSFIDFAVLFETHNFSREELSKINFNPHTYAASVTFARSSGNEDLLANLVEIAYEEPGFLLHDPAMVAYHFQLFASLGFINTFIPADSVGRYLDDSQILSLIEFFSPEFLSNHLSLESLMRFHERLENSFYPESITEKINKKVITRKFGFQLLKCPGFVDFKILIQELVEPGVAGDSVDMIAKGLQEALNLHTLSVSEFKELFLLLMRLAAAAKIVLPEKNLREAISMACGTDSLMPLLDNIARYQVFSEEFFFEFREMFDIKLVKENLALEFYRENNWSKEGSLYVDLQG